MLHSMILSGSKKASVLPTQRTTQSGRLEILNHSDRLEMKSTYPEEQYDLMYFLKAKVSCVTGCANT